MIKRAAAPLALSALAAFAALACNLLQSTAEDIAATAESAISEIEIPDELPGDAPADQPPPQNDLDSSGGPESLDLDDAENYREPVDLVSSYRFTMRFAFEADSGERGSVTGSGERTFDPQATRVRFEAFDNAAQTEELPLEFSMIGSVVSVVGSDVDPGCATFPTGGMVTSPLSFLIVPDGFLTGQAARLRPDQEVNGVPVYRFALDSSNVLQDELDIVEFTDGTIYIAREGGYVVRLEINGTGPSEMLSGSPDLVGRLAYLLDYYDFDQPIEIVPPEGCEPVSADAGIEYPVTDDAYQLTALGGFVSYMTDLPLDEVVQFYKDEMAAAGWTLAGDLSDAAEPTMIFTRGDAAATVVLRQQETDVGIIGGG